MIYTFGIEIIREGEVNIETNKMIEAKTFETALGIMKKSVKKEYGKDSLIRVHWFEFS